jgi:long-chain fatty acid transport protein
MQRLLPLLFLFLLEVLGAGRAGGSGFEIQERSGRGVGSAFAGEGALGEDGAIVFHNPAGMTLLPGTQAMISADLIAANIDFENEGSSVNADLGGGLLTGKDTGGAGEYGIVPSSYLTHQLTDRWFLGFAANAPFGLKTQWDKGWVGRYHAVESSLRTINLNPAFAFRAFPWLSLGAGMSAQYAKAVLTNSIDLGGVCAIFGGQAGLPPGVCGAIGLAPQQSDGFVRVVGDDWSFGWNLGVLLEPRRDTRIGLAYRSRVSHGLSGDVDFTIPKKAAILQSTGALVDSAGTANVTLPDTASLSAFHHIDRRWAIFGDVTWTHWDTFQQIVVKFRNPAQPTAVEPEEWDDTFRLALGGRYEATEHWIFRAGTAYDMSPVPDDVRRSARIPDSDRIWASLGVGYRLNDVVRFDLGYSHLFALAADTRSPDQNTGHVLRGEFTGDANIVGVQIAVRLP